MEPELITRAISESLIVAVLIWRMIVQDKRIDRFDSKLMDETSLNSPVMDEDS